MFEDLGYELTEKLHIGDNYFLSYQKDFVHIDFSHLAKNYLFVNGNLDYLDF